MKGVQLPFYSEADSQKERETSNDDIDFKKSSIKIFPRKCLTLASVQQNHARHPYFYQLQYFSKIEGLELPEDISKKIYFIKLLSMQQGFSFQEFLQICYSFNNLLFNKSSVLNSKMSVSCLSEISFSFTASGMTENGKKERLNELLPDINLNKYEELIKNTTLSQEEISNQITKILCSQQQKVIKSNQNPSISSTNSISSNIINKNTAAPGASSTASMQKADYKLPQLRAKGFLACPKNLKSQIIEFLQNNADKPYPSSILAMMYFYGVEESIQQSKQLGQSFLKNVAPYKYFDLGQSIIYGMQSGDAVLADFLYFILSCCADGEKDNQMINDDLPLFFGSGFSSSQSQNLFARLDQDSDTLSRFMQAIKVWNNLSPKNSDEEMEKFKQQISQMMTIFQNLLQDIQSNQFSSVKNIEENVNFNQQSQQNSTKTIFSKNAHQETTDYSIIEETLTKMENPIALFSIQALQKFGLKMSTPLEQSRLIELLCLAADNQHIKAFAKLATILYNQYYQLDQLTKSKLIQYLQKGCDLLIPSCMKVQIQLKIMGDAHYRDYQGAYNLMKDLFFLGCDAFRFDLVRLAKFYKDFQFLSLYSEYLKNIEEKNIDLLTGLLLEKGYGMKQNLHQASAIYQSLLEKNQKDNAHKYDLSLNYRLAKCYKAQNRQKESEKYFKQIIDYSQNNTQKLDIINLYKVGKMYEKGLGTSQNFRKAEEIYQYILHYDKDKILQNTNFNINSSPIQTKENLRQDKKKFSAMSTRSLSLLSNSERLNETVISEEHQQLGMNRNKCNSDNRKQLLFRKQETRQPENFIGQKEKMWEHITKQLTVKKRVDNLKYITQNKIEENDTFLDFEEFDHQNTCLDTHYFSSTHYKPSIHAYNTQVVQE